MTLAAQTPSRTFAPGFALAAVLLAGLTMVRLAGLHYSVVDLFFDESQYWAWSRDLAFGYFSKPPLLAWIIATSRAVCGDGEACVRAASPILYFGTSLAIYAIADEIYDARTAFWSALAFALLPGVVFSSRIISTDVPLLFSWALALLAFVKLLRAPDWRWSLLFGTALGLGMLAKYAMAYFLAGIVLAALFDRAAREVLLRPQTWAALALALLILSPNALWNIQNGFLTLKHTGDNIQGSKGLQLSPLGALEFLGTQFGVAGPLLFGALLIALLGFRRSSVTDRDRLMLAIALPPLVTITALGVFRSVNANWAATTFVSATVVVVAMWAREGRVRLVGITLALGVIVQAALLAGDVMAYQVAIPSMGPKSNPYWRTLGWRALAEVVEKKAREVNAKAVVVEGRPEAAALGYYMRNAPQPILSWPVGDSPNSQFDVTNALHGSIAEPVLFVTPCPWDKRQARLFSQVTLHGRIIVPNAPTSNRWAFYLLSGKRVASGPVPPLGPCAP